MRQHAADAIFTWSAKFTLPARQVFADPLLSRLAFFARYESLLRCLDVRNMRCEPRPVQLLLGKALELQAAGDDRFQIVSGAMQIEPGGYPEWLLVTDDEPAGGPSSNTATTPAAPSCGKAANKAIWRWWASRKSNGIRSVRPRR